MKKLILTMFVAGLSLAAFGQGVPVGADDPTRGCFKDWQKPVWVDCWECWNCGDPINPTKKCYGECQFNCGDCISALYDEDDETWEITVFNPDGTVVGVITGVTVIYATEHNDGHNYTRYHFE